jgi:hypothetical protein
MKKYIKIDLALSFFVEEAVGVCCDKPSLLVGCMGLSEIIY